MACHPVVLTTHIPGLHLARLEAGRRWQGSVGDGRGKWHSAEQPKGQRCGGDRWVGGVGVKVAGQEKHKVLAY